MRIDKWEKEFDKFGQIISIPDGYFDEVIVRFGKGVTRKEKILCRGMFLNPDDIKSFISQFLQSQRQEFKKVLEGLKIENISTPNDVIIRGSEAKAYYSNEVIQEFNTKIDQIKVNKNQPSSASVIFWLLLFPPVAIYKMWKYQLYQNSLLSGQVKESE